MAEELNQAQFFLAPLLLALELEWAWHGSIRACGQYNDTHTGRRHFAERYYRERDLYRKVTGFTGRNLYGN